MSKEFAHGAEQGYATIVVAIASVTLLMEGDNIGITQVPEHSSLSPAESGYVLYFLGLVSKVELLILVWLCNFV